MGWIKKRTALRQDHSTRRLLIILLLVTLGLGALFITAYVFARLDAHHFDDQEQPVPEQSGVELSLKHRPAT